MILFNKTIFSHDDRLDSVLEIITPQCHIALPLNNKRQQLFRIARPSRQRLSDISQKDSQSWVNRSYIGSYHKYSQLVFPESFRI